MTYLSQLRIGGFNSLCHCVVTSSMPWECIDSLLPFSNFSSNLVNYRRRCCQVDPVSSNHSKWRPHRQTSLIHVGHAAGYKHNPFAILDHLSSSYQGHYRVLGVGCLLSSRRTDHDNIGNPHRTFAHSIRLACLGIPFAPHSRRRILWLSLCITLCSLVLEVNSGLFASKHSNGSLHRNFLALPFVLSWYSQNEKENQHWL